MYEIRKLEEGDDGEDNYDEQNAILESICIGWMNE